MAKTSPSAQAVKECLRVAREGAKPWVMPPAVAKKLGESFKKDFDREIPDQRAWRLWKPRATRLSHYIGVLSAFLAEKDAHLPRRPGKITFENTMGAVELVKKVCPDRPTTSPQPMGRLCRLVEPSATVRSRAESWLTSGPNGGE